MQYKCVCVIEDSVCRVLGEGEGYITELLTHKLPSHFDLSEPSCPHEFLLCLGRNSSAFFLHTSNY